MEKTLFEQKVEKAREVANDLSKYPSEVVADALHMLGIGKIDEMPIQITIPKEIVCSTSEFIRRRTLNFLEGAWKDYQKLILNMAASEQEIRNNGHYGYIHEPFFKPIKVGRHEREYNYEVGKRITKGKELEYTAILNLVGHEIPCDMDSWTKAYEKHSVVKEKTHKLLFNMVSNVFCMTDEQRNQKIVEREAAGDSLFRIGQTVTVDGDFPSYNYFSGPMSGFVVAATNIDQGKAMLMVKHKHIEPIDVSAADVWKANPLIELQRPLV